MARVRAGARLHLGFLDLAGDLGRRFGSFGLGIDGFETHIDMRRAARFSATGAEHARVETLLRRLGERFPDASPIAVDVAAAIPAHAGLGSGTQLALALALGFRRLNGLAADAGADAAALLRGARSGLGVGLFDHGGFLLDAGRGPATELPPIVSRLAFPADWRVLLLIDAGMDGAHGAAERAAFAALPAFPAADAADICRRALMQVLPGVAEADFAAFADGLSAIQRRLGDHFAPAQGGGRFASPRVGAVAAALERAGARGVGQSSWGPTGFAFARDPDEAAHLLALASKAARGEIRAQVHAARAHGAECVLLS
ncbi:MAG: GHMP kinase [Pseudomonadota bacterium]|nr:GHMP kinase [Pseudomonadota bacterium]